MIETLLYVVLALGAVAVILELIAFRRNASVDLPRLWQNFEALEKNSQVAHQAVLAELTKTSDALRTELAQLRETTTTATRQAREELAGTIQALQPRFAQLDQALQMLQAETGKHLTETGNHLKAAREESAKALAAVQEALVKTVIDTGKAQQTHAETLVARQEKQTAAADQRLESVRIALETKLQALHDAQAQRLDQVRAALDEKLLATEKRLADTVRSSAGPVQPRS